MTGEILPAASAPPIAVESTIDTHLSQEARDAIAAGTATSTRRNYAGDWARFTEWCTSVGRRSLPATAETVVEYTAWCTRTIRPRTGRTYSVTAIERALSAIRTAHRLAGHTPPETKAARMVLRGYAEHLALTKSPAAQPRKATPAEPPALRKALATLDRNTLIGKRDAALMLIGYAVAGRGSELVPLDIPDFTDVEEGLEVPIYRVKKKEFTQTAIPFGSVPSTCPVRAFRALVMAMAEVGRTEGPLFVRIDRHGRVAPPMFRGGKPIGDPSGRMTAEAASDIVERSMEAAELEGRWRSHSLRRGFVNASRKAGHDIVKIGRHGGWADGSKALLGYIDDADKWEDNPVAGTGL
ncbi:tyrosine-type recombinase/integrase [Streptomyces sp. NPDC053079]|uniref:tyrosine-type recombinase/integrase n=1 Tax=Streptomyces sp. NPDC053079 TaxID=3365697 RepID=UPI0037D03FD7